MPTPRKLSLYLFRHGEAYHNVYEEKFKKYALIVLAEKIKLANLTNSKQEALKELVMMKTTEIVLENLGSILPEKFIDPSLTTRGKLQSKAVGEYIKNYDIVFDVVAVSPLNRALQCLHESGIQPAAKSKAYIIPQFREVSGGDRLPDKINEKIYPDDFCTKIFSTVDLKTLWPNQRENDEQVAKRFTQGIIDLSNLNKNAVNIAIFAHKGTATRFCKYHGYKITPPGNCEIIYLRVLINNNLLKAELAPKILNCCELEHNKHTTHNATEEHLSIYADIFNALRSKIEAVIDSMIIDLSSYEPTHEKLKTCTH